MCERERGSVCIWVYLYIVCLLCVSKYVMWCVIHMWVRVWCRMSSVCEHVHMTWYVMCINTCAWFVCMYFLAGMCVFHHYCILWYLDRLPNICTMWLQVIISACGEQQCLLIEETKTLICLQGCPQSRFHPTMLESGAHNSMWLSGSVSWLAPNPSPNFCFLTFINYACMYVHAYT